MAKTINNLSYAELADTLLVTHKTNNKNGVTLTDIPYVNNGSDLTGMDCQGQMEYLLRQLGVKANWRGSNDMFRNACSWTGTIAECKKKFGSIPKGAWLFIVEFDGGEVARGYKDGLGDASHVGVYTGMGAGVVHASASRKCVASSTQKNAWTHVGLCKYIDYGFNVDNNQQVEVRIMEKTMVVYADSGSNVNLRDSANGALMARVPVGTEVTAIGTSGDWTQIMYGDNVGWMMSKFLRDKNGTSNSGTYTIQLSAATAHALKEALINAGI